MKGVKRQCWSEGPPPTFLRCGCCETQGRVVCLCSRISWLGALPISQPQASYSSVPGSLKQSWAAGSSSLWARADALHWGAAKLTLLTVMKGSSEGSTTVKCQAPRSLALCPNNLLFPLSFTENNQNGNVYLARWARSALPSHSLELWSAWFKSVLVLALKKGKTKLGLFLTRAKKLKGETTVSPFTVAVLSCLGIAQQGILGLCDAARLLQVPIKFRRLQKAEMFLSPVTKSENPRIAEMHFEAFYLCGKYRKKKIP